MFVGSHFPISQANEFLQFDRRTAIGMHLDIPAGDTIGWQPGETRRVQVVEYAGLRRIRGFDKPSNER